MSGKYQKKPSKQEFEKYLEVQALGEFNMLDASKVKKATGLSGEKYMYIIYHYEDLLDEYNLNDQ